MDRAHQLATEEAEDLHKGSASGQVLVQALGGQLRAQWMSLPSHMWRVWLALTLTWAWMAMPRARTGQRQRKFWYRPRVASCAARRLS